MIEDKKVVNMVMLDFGLMTITLFLGIWMISSASYNGFPTSILIYFLSALFFSAAAFFAIMISQTVQIYSQILVEKELRETA